MTTVKIITIDKDGNKVEKEEAPINRVKAIQDLKMTQEEVLQAIRDKKKANKK
jgi:hypothetical protein